MTAWFAEQVLAADLAGFWIGTAIAGGAGALLLRRGLTAFWRLRLIRDTPTARVRSAPQGYVELAGSALPARELLRARLTGTPCCWYRWRIQERRRSGRNDRWVTLERGDAEAPFLLEDATGRCLVEPAGAELRLRARVSWYSAVRGGRGEPSALQRFLGQGRRYRMIEERVLEQEPVYVLGHLETPRRGAREREALTRQLLSQWKRDPERMQRFDRDGDGEIGLEEWQHARRRAAQLAAEAERRVAAAPILSRVVASDDPRRPFLISTEGEDALVGRSRWEALGATLAGALLGVGAVFALSIRLTAGG